MSETLLVVAAVLSLLLMIVYGFMKKQRNLENELESSRRIKTIAGLKLPRNASLEDVLKGMLSTLARAYDSIDSRLSFSGSVFGEFLFSEGAENGKSLSVLERIDNALAHIDRKHNSTREARGQSGKMIVFVVDDQDFTCRIELRSDAELAPTEYWYMQELIREKLSRSLLDKMEQVVRTALKDLGTPYALMDHRGNIVHENDAFITSFHRSNESELLGMMEELNRSGKDRRIFSSKSLGRRIGIMKVDRDLFAVFSPSIEDSVQQPFGATDSLLLDAFESMNLGIVILMADGKVPNPDYKITSINGAFYRIFGLDGSSAQSDEVAEILASAVRPDETGKSNSGGARIPGEFNYMRRDGLKVRARLTIIRGSYDSQVVIFEPVENTDFILSTYKQLFESARRLFVEDDLRQFLKDLMDITRADGVALVRFDTGSNKFEVKEKSGFIINVPQLLVSDLSTREFVNAQGYLAAPVRERDLVSSAVVALKPNQEVVEAVIAAAKILEAYFATQGELLALKTDAAKLDEEAKRADAANRSKSEFLANMSHEIRTPLNSIIGFADIIHSDTEDLDKGLLLDFSGNIVTAGKHLLSLINDVLDLAKVETGKMKLDLQEFSVREVVESISRILRPLLDRKHITIDTKLEDGVDVLVADTVKFKQILYNLLNNAINYSPDGSVVRLQMVKSGIGAELRVIDKGTGIKKEDLDKLFKPFVQLDDSRSGSGLGLALTKRLVELHGGNIWIDSVYGAGTTIVVYLPNSNPGHTDLHEKNVTVPLPAEEIYFVTEDEQLYSLFTAIMDGAGFRTTRMSPNFAEDIENLFTEEVVLVVDATPDNLTERVVNACRNAGKTLLLTRPDNIRLVSELLKDYESKLSFIDRRNFTKSELIAELNTAGRV